MTWHAADNEAAAAALKGTDAIQFLDAPIGRRKAFPKATAELAVLINALFQPELIAE